jgi:hypothetical protein
MGQLKSKFDHQHKLMLSVLAKINPSAREEYTEIFADKFPDKTDIDDEMLEEHTIIAEEFGIDLEHIVKEDFFKA